jgi:hypothetical protein
VELSFFDQISHFSLNILNLEVHPCPCELGLTRTSLRQSRNQKSEGQVELEKKSNQYDTVAASGGQEYSIFVRQFGGEDESWLPSGSITVPRGTQVSDAIFGNEEPLKAAIVRTFPKLGGFES